MVSRYLPLPLFFVLSLFSFLFFSFSLSYLFSDFTFIFFIFFSSSSFHFSSFLSTARCNECSSKCFVRISFSYFPLLGGVLATLILMEVGVCGDGSLVLYHTTAVYTKALSYNGERYTRASIRLRGTHTRCQPACFLSVDQGLPAFLFVVPHAYSNLHAPPTHRSGFLPLVVDASTEGALPL